MSLFPIGRGSTLLAEQRFYDETYLIGDGGPLLFILDAALIRGPSGRERMRVKRDVIDFPSVESMVAAIRDGGWMSAPLDGNPQWRPDLSALVRIGDE